jgi:FtsP/CotA-like multicopper oxidase with cupredoxin domain
MLSKGWVYEGVAMCVAAGSDDCISDLSYGALPGPPTALVATPGNASVTLTFAPASDGGLPIIGYTASCGSAGISRTGTNTQSPITVRGVPNGIRQACTVFATNTLGNGAVSQTVFAIPEAAANTTYNALWIPPLQTPTTTSGTATYDLTLAPSSQQFMPGAATATYSYNGNAFWGPTLVMNKGDLVRMQVRNTLTEATTTHWHGLLLPGTADGGPHSIIAAGTIWLTAPFTVKNNAATYWYHPHMHEMTQKQVTLGGRLHHRQGSRRGGAALPRTYGVDDIPLALTSQRFTTIDGVANQLRYAHAVRRLHADQWRHARRSDAAEATRSAAHSQQRGRTRLQPGLQRRSNVLRDRQ